MEESNIVALGKHTQGRVEQIVRHHLLDAQLALGSLRAETAAEPHFARRIPGRHHQHFRKRLALDLDSAWGQQQGGSGFVSTGQIVQIAVLPVLEADVVFAVPGGRAQQHGHALVRQRVENSRTAALVKRGWKQICVIANRRVERGGFLGRRGLRRDQ